MLKSNEAKDLEIKSLRAALADAQLEAREIQMRSDGVGSQLKKVETKLQRLREDYKSTVDGISINMLKLFN